MSVYRLDIGGLLRNKMTLETKKKCAVDMMPVDEAALVVVGRFPPLCKKAWSDVTGLNSLKR
jgi:hypothetical protein